MIQVATFIHSDPGHAKADKSLEVKQKKGKGDGKWSKRVLNHTLDINFIA